MRYQKGHGAAVRQRIIEIASSKFREEGIEATGIASVMSDAGLTHGGFYSHFASRDELVKSALQHGLRARSDHYAELLANGSDLAEVIRRYVSARHRDNPGNGCTVATLAPEVARQSGETRAVFTRGLEVFLGMVGRQWSTGTAKARRDKAIVLYAMMVGTVQMARSTNDEILSDQILASGLAAALDFAKS